MSPPSDIRAVVIVGLGKPEVKTVPLPKLRDNYILVRTTAVGLNPTDWKHVDGARVGEAVIGTRVGCDYAGIVEEVGKAVTKPFKKGDLQIVVPENLSDSQAASLGVGITTVRPSSSGEQQRIFIYGGSTATGILGIQYAVASGYRVATTCSPHNFEYLKSLGADAVFAYRSPTVLDDIKAWADGCDSLTLAWDCVASKETAKLCAAVLSRTKEGHYRSLLPVPEEVVRSVNEQVDAGFTFALGLLLADGRVKPADTEVNRGGKGLEGVLVGLRELKEGRVSGRKLVYTL
ncbi:chaperonin 10-like protein [Podospora australis]|uniref:Chaperonin 10-like protein n=1 Tax=Podospora australis TaxID=1536484 RepID=A0AAN6WU48_9PEZI|nr:chaperonin 10-like protein [Podospora australis]